MWVCKDALLTPIWDLDDCSFQTSNTEFLHKIMSPSVCFEEFPAQAKK